MLVLLISEKTKSKKARESISINQEKKANEEAEEEGKKKAFYNLLFLCGFSFLCSEGRKRRKFFDIQVSTIHSLTERGDSLQI